MIPQLSPEVEARYRELTTLDAKSLDRELAQRVKTQAQLLVAVQLQKWMSDQVKDPECPRSIIMDIAKWSSKVGDLEPKANIATGGGGPAFTVNINLVEKQAGTTINIDPTISLGEVPDYIDAVPFEELMVDD